VQCLFTSRGGNGGTARNRGLIDVDLDAVGRPDVVRIGLEALQVMDRAVGLGHTVEPSALELAVDVRREHPDARRRLSQLRRIPKPACGTVAR
jgi:hypothetical protein